MSQVNQLAELNRMIDREQHVIKVMREMADEPDTPPDMWGRVHEWADAIETALSDVKIERAGLVASIRACFPGTIDDETRLWICKFYGHR